MHYPDLGTECQVATGPTVRAIGWLERGKPFPTTERVDKLFLAALKKQVLDGGRWLSVVAMGIHRCDLGGCSAAGAQHAVIPSATCVYVVPELVVHYVEEHRYAPPPEFVAAVRACPEQSSDAFIDLLVPFASTWKMTAATVRTVALRARETRKSAAEAAAQRDANKGSFKW